MNSVFRARIGVSTILFFIVLLSAFTASMGAKISPLTFGNDATDDATWKRLVQYKLWATGSQGILIKGEAHITDTTGYVGSAQGGLTYENTKHALGGPLIFAGPFKVYDGQDTVVSGPSRFSTMQYTNQVNWRGKQNVFNGKFCLTNGGSCPEQVGSGMTCTCDGVPAVDSDLRLPTVVNNFKYNVTLNSISVNNNIYYIDVPEGEGAYNIYVNGDIQFMNDAHLIVRMPHKGRSTRIIVNGQIKLSSRSHIQVMYADASEVMQNGRWGKTGLGSAAGIDDYSGDLLFYVSKGFNNESLTPGVIVEGTYIVPGKVTIMQHFSFAGQILADQIEIQQQFKSEFRYVPFEGPKVDTKAIAKGELTEGNGAEQISFSLTESAAVNVSFKYCYAFESNANEKTLKSDKAGTITAAHQKDLENKNSSLPLCANKKYKTAHFSKGQMVSQEKEMLTALDDDLTENKEYFYLYIYDVEGAVLDNGLKSDSIKIYINDNDDKAVGTDTTIVSKIINSGKDSIGYEDVPFAITSFPAFSSSDGKTKGARLAEYQVKIASLPTAGSLKIRGVDAKTGDVVSSADLQKGQLTFVSDLNDYGDSAKSYAYSSFSFVVMNKNGVEAPEAKTMSIQMMPVNDAPKFVSFTGNYISGNTFIFSESTPKGDLVGNVKALDVDMNLDNAATLTYSFGKFVPEDSCADVTKAFSIDSKTGEIRVADSLSYSKKGHKYKGVVVITDNGVPGNRMSVLKDSVTFYIELKQIKHPPEIVRNPNKDTVVVTEHSKLKTIVMQYKATDENLDDALKLSYKLVSTSGAAIPFGIDSIGPDTAVVYIANELDYETLGKVYDLIVVVSDNQNASLAMYDTASLTILVKDTNEAPIVKNQYSFQALDSFKKSDSVGVVDASDLDIDATPKTELSYSMPKVYDVTNPSKKTDASALFAIDSKTGKVYVNSDLDASLQNHVFEGEVTVTDNGSKQDFCVGPLKDKVCSKGKNMSSKTVVSISIPEKNYPPKFDSKSYTFSVKENSPTATPVGSVSASDQNPADRLVFSIADATLPFEVVSSGTLSATIQVKKNAKIDYETQSKYSFKVYVSDGSLTDSANVTVNVDDVNEKPEITTVNDFFVKENSLVGTLVGTVNVADQDTWTVMSYALGDSTKNASKFFNIAPAGSCSKGVCQGNITVKVDSLDFEKDQLYIIKVFATDNGKSYGLPPDMSDTAVFKIHVTDENDKPVFDSASYTFSIDENSAPFVGVGKVHATDEDLGTTLTYSMQGITSGVSSLFEMDPTTGEISVKDGAKLDYETLANAKYELTAIVTDNGNPAKKDSAKVTINVNDVNENPVLDKSKKLNVTEWTPIGTSIGNVTDSDLDTNKAFMKHKYFAIGGDTLLFAIDSLTGKVSVRDTIFDATESISSYRLTVRVVDYSTSTLLYDHGDIEIDLTHVNDPPKMITEKFYVTENAQEGDFVGDLAKLVTDDKTPFDDLKFSIVGGSNEFEISVNYNGRVTVKAGAKIDYETRKSYTIRIRATDEDSASSEQDYLVFVRNVNEAPVLNDTSFTISENSKGGTSVGRLIASDEDDALQDLQFSLDTACSYTEFNVSATGLIHVNSGAVLDYETQSEYTLTVWVTDKGGLATSAEVTIYVTDENEPPAFEKNEFRIPENSPENTVVGNLLAHDPEDPDSVLIYSLVGTSLEFEVSKDGKITVKKGAQLDYETKHDYVIKVSVMDSEGMTKEGTAKIYLDDVREPPTLADTTLHVPENVPKGTKVGVLKANNPEGDKLKYLSITSSTKFKVNEDGTVVTIGSIDYEDEKQYELQVVIVGDSCTDTATVTIMVDNIIERPEIKITRADDGDTVWIQPDTIYTKNRDIDFEWKADNKFLPDTLVSFPKDSTYIFALCYEDVTMDLPGCDTVIVKINSSIPKVNISKSAEDTSAITGVTIVEQVDEKDTNFYVNHEDNQVRIHIQDKALDVDSSFVVDLHLDSLKNSKKSLDRIKKIAKNEITLDDAEKYQTKRSSISSDVYEVSFRKLVGDDTVTVTYNTDKNGKTIKNHDGDVIMKVSTNMEIDGETVVVSYNVNGKTGEVVKNENDGIYEFSYSYVDKFGGLVGVRYSVDEKGEFAKTDVGDLGYQVSYTYKNRYGNSATKNIIVVVDKIVPVVKIVSPDDKSFVNTSGVDVKWTVNGEIQDTLVIQGLKNGWNTIVRTYRDKAGNEGTDSVNVYLKNPKELEVHIEKPVTIVSDDSVHKYYGVNPPEKGQSYAVSVYNPYKEQEIETLIGGSFGEKKGSKREAYPGMDGHLGPTLVIDALAPRCGDKTAGGLCTLDDIIERDGLVSLDAGGGWDRKKVSVDQFVEDYCSADFRKEYMRKGKVTNIYNTSLHVTIWIYTNLGGFLDKYSFTQEINDPDFVNEVGEVQMAFEMKPNLEGNVTSESGRLLGTGAYIFSTEVKSVSELRCKLPDANIGDKRYVSDELRKPFGYKRPITKKKKK